MFGHIECERVVGGGLKGIEAGFRIDSLRNTCMYVFPSVCVIVFFNFSSSFPSTAYGGNYGSTFS